MRAGALFDILVTGMDGGGDGGDVSGDDAGDGSGGGGGGGGGGDDDGDADVGEPNLKKDNVVLPPEQFLSEGADPKMGLDLNED